MAHVLLRKYNTAATILFTLTDYGTTDLEPLNGTINTNNGFAAGDVTIIKDEGTSASTTNLPVNEGNGWYSLALTSTEMSAARIGITVKDLSGPKLWEDEPIYIDTYGNASATHPFDLGTASTAQTGDNYARLGAPVGASHSADVAAVKAVLPAALVSGRIDASVGAAAANTITASALATDAVTELVTAILTTVAPESYAAVGAEGSIVQLLYAIMQYQYRLSISGTTGTVGKLDGSAAATITYNSTTPTSRQRAT